MKRSDIVKLIHEVLEEESATGAVGGYSTPFAFSKKGAGANAATKATQKLGFKAAPRPKHPSNTKMIDYLNERGAGHYATPHVFVSEEEMMNSEAVKHTEEMGYKLVNKNQKASDKKSK
jgi:hypothetical protein